MTDRDIRITPDALRQLAAQHDGIADELSVARSAGQDILDTVATHGPIMRAFKDAVADVVARRDAAFAANEADHRAAADRLRAAADRFGDQEDINVAGLQF
jgi:hypothetical protein